ncbi:MAG: hypothetical protein OXN97_09310 [Bryobacterales bacterium]|nr:hypothetical protein [Bryobacterales bacterium]MDE0624813.1 hypothetical protein [Bryobacterales bacterium]
MARKDLCLEQIQGRSERPVKQALYANRTLIAVARMFADRGEADGQAAHANRPTNGGDARQSLPPPEIRKIWLTCLHPALSA